MTTKMTSGKRRLKGCYEEKRAILLEKVLTHTEVGKGDHKLQRPRVEDDASSGARRHPRIGVQHRPMEGQLILLSGIPYAAVQRPLAGQVVPGGEQLVQAAAPVPEVLTAATSRAVAAVLAHRRQPALVQSPKVPAIVHHQLVGGLRQREAAQLEVQRVVDDDGEEGEEAATLEGGQREKVKVVQQED